MMEVNKVDKEIKDGMAITPTQICPRRNVLFISAPLEVYEYLAVVGVARVSILGSEVCPGLAP